MEITSVRVGALRSGPGHSNDTLEVEAVVPLGANWKAIEAKLRKEVEQTLGESVEVVKTRNRKLREQGFGNLVREQRLLDIEKAKFFKWAKEHRALLAVYETATGQHVNDWDGIPF